MSFLNSHESSIQLVQRILGENLGFPPDAILPHLRLQDDLQADSLDIVEILVALESETGFSFDEDHYEQASYTVQGLIDLIDSYLSRQ